MVAELAVGATADQLSWGRLPDGPLMLAVGNRLGQLYVWDSADWLAGPRVLSSEPRRIDGLDLMAFGDRMLAAVTVRTETGTTRPILWDALSADQLTELDPQAGNAYTAALATEDDGLLLAVGLNSGQVIIYRPLNEEILDTIAVNDGAVWAVDWARADDDRLLLAIASDRGTVQVWDRRAASVIATFNTGETPVLSGGWGVTPRGRLLLTVSAASSAQVWDPVSGRQLARIEHPSQVNTVSFAPPGARPGEPDRMYLAAGCQNGELLVHTLRVTEAPARAGGAAGTGLAAGSGGAARAAGAPGRSPVHGSRGTREGPAGARGQHDMGSASRRGAGREDAAGERQPGRNGAGVGSGHG